MITPLQLATNAIAQGVLAAILILGIAILYFDRLSKISHDINSMSESIDEIEGNVAAVDLDTMERTLTKLEYVLGQSGEERFHTGEGTVYHTLDKTGMEVAISYVTTHPESHSTYMGDDGEESKDYEGPEIVVEFEFEEELNMVALMDNLTTREDIAQTEEDLFEEEAGISPSSPFELTVHFPTGDPENVAEFIPQYLDLIDEVLADVRNRTEDVESEIQRRLE